MDDKTIYLLQITIDGKEPEEPIAFETSDARDRFIRLGGIQHCYKGTHKITQADDALLIDDKPIDISLFEVELWN